MFGSLCVCCCLLLSVARRAAPDNIRGMARRWLCCAALASPIAPRHPGVWPRVGTQAATVPQTGCSSCSTVAVPASTSPRPSGAPLCRTAPGRQSWECQTSPRLSQFLVSFFLFHPEGAGDSIIKYSFSRTLISPSKVRRQRAHKTERITTWQTHSSE